MKPCERFESRIADSRRYVEKESKIQNVISHAHPTLKEVCLAMRLLPRQFSFPIMLISIVLLGACSRTGATQSAPPEPQTVMNIDASGDDFVYYSLRDNRPVEASEADGEAWDIAFQSTNIRVNGSVQLVEASFGAVLTAPEEGYQSDEEAIPGGSGNGWYLYDSSVHVVMPIPNRTLVLKTAAGAYAKVEILSFNRMDPASGSDEGGDPRYYSFRFAYQPDGSRMLGSE